jgi:hypothetical protein
VPEYDSIFSGERQSHFQKIYTIADIYKLKPPKKRSCPSLLIEIEGSDSEIEAEEESAPDADSSNLDPIVEMDFDLHDFSIGQLEKDITRRLETSEENVPIEEENVCFFLH